MLNKFFFKNLVYLPTTRLQHLTVQEALKELDKSQYMSETELREYQCCLLHNLVKYAHHNVPFYKGISHITSLSELRKLPILTKSDIQDNYDALVSRNTYKYTVQKSTGGSTGAPLKLKHTNITRSYHLAAMWRGYSWANIDIGDKRGHFWSVPLSWKKELISKTQDIVTNRRRYSAFSFRKEDLEEYVKRLNRFNPVYFYGYSSMLEKFGLFLLESGTQLQFVPKAVITTAELLSENRRNIIEEAFQTGVFDEYGCGEVGTIAHQCEHGAMHINSENLIVEILDDNNEPVPDGTVGNVVVTLLRNTVMPLIRYKIGDLAALESRACACGRTLPVMTSPVGRVVEYLKSKDGKAHYGSVFLLALLSKANSNSRAVNQLQVIQKGYEDIIFNVVPGKDFSNSIPHFLDNEAKALFGPSCKTKTKIVEEIPRAKSGKLRTVICEV